MKTVSGNAIVSVYVLEHLLGQYAASDDEDTIKAGIEMVRRVLAHRYVHRNEAELVKSTIHRHRKYQPLYRAAALLRNAEKAACRKSMRHT